MSQNEKWWGRLALRSRLGLGLAVLQIVHLCFAHFQSRITLGWSAVCLSGVAMSVLGQWFLGLAIERWVQRRALSTPLGNFWLVLNALASAYLLASHSGFDPHLALATWHLLFSKASTVAVVQTFHDTATLAFLAISLLIVLVHTFAPTPRSSLPFPKKLAIFASGAALQLLQPASTYNEISGILVSSAQAALSAAAAPLLSPGTYPLVRVSQAEAPIVAPSERPVPVILLMVESFNARFVEKSVDGHVVTPVFNELLKRSVYFQHFYGNSVQTSRGQFSALYGVPPVVRGSIFDRTQKVRLQGLPDKLRQNGYQTTFLQALADVDFEGTRAFFSAHGFDRVEAPFQAKSSDQAYVWGWGPEDRLFYRDAFSRLDELDAQDKRPQFATLATICSHMRFNVPERRRLLFPQPENMEQRYSNALHLADADLASFMTELSRRPYLDDALVLVTGDHSYPTGQHQIEFNESGIYEESFRTPLLVFWPKHLKPERIVDRVASQIDIPPTVLHLLNIPLGVNHFVGRSILSSAKRDPVPLYQPYNGEYRIAVKDSVKLLLRARSGERTAFLLPNEDEPIAAEQRPVFAELSATILGLSAIEAALSQDQVWPDLAE